MDYSGSQGLTFYIGLQWSRYDEIGELWFDYLKFHHNKSFDTLKSYMNQHPLGEGIWGLDKLKTIQVVLQKFHAIMAYHHYVYMYILRSFPNFNVDL